MKEGVRFLVALVVGFILVCGAVFVAFYLNLGVPTESSRWTFEVNQKKQMLAARTASPKLLLVGGSATLFGISARQIESQTGYRTINLGTHAALGPNYILRWAREASKPGDTVLLCLEYELYDRGKIERTWSDRLFLDYIVARDVPFFRTLSPLEQWNVFMLTSNTRLLQGLKNRVRTEPPRPEQNVYDSRYIDDWGDQTHHAEAQRPSGREAMIQSKSALAQGIPEHPGASGIIAAFCQWSRDHQVRVLATFPNLVDYPEYRLPAARRSAEVISKLFGELGVPVLGDYTDSLLPLEQIFDARSHPTEEGTRARTERLTSQLAPYLK